MSLCWDIGNGIEASSLFDRYGLEDLSLVWIVDPITVCKIEYKYSVKVRPSSLPGPRRTPDHNECREQSDASP